ncbi:hypothetical protein P692DRAFT_20732882, partial [Suillus brevipes Sb2]
YDIDRQLIPPTQYESKLCGAVVEVHFAFFHHHIRKSKRHIFNAVLRELIVLRPPSNMPSSPLKRRNIGTGPASDKPSKGKKRAHTSGRSNFKFCASLTFISTFTQKPSKGHVLCMNTQFAQLFLNIALSARPSPKSYGFVYCTTNDV